METNEFFLHEFPSKRWFRSGTHSLVYEGEMTKKERWRHLQGGPKSKPLPNYQKKC